MTLARSTTPLDRARSIFGADLIGPDDVGAALGIDAVALASEEPDLLDEVPYALDILEAAHRRGELLVFRVANDGAEPLTVLRLRERFAGAIDPKLFKGVGYLLKDEWTLDQEPFAATATCRLEWRLIHREPIASTCNLSYELQDAALARYAQSIGLESRLHRRSGIEMVYDTVIVERTRGVRLLTRTWDWSDTPTADGGYVTAGEFNAAGLHVLGYSRAVRFGTLGICAQQ